MSNSEVTQFIVGEFTHHGVERGVLNGRFGCNLQSEHRTGPDRNQPLKSFYHRARCALLRRGKT